MFVKLRYLRKVTDDIHWEREVVWLRLQSSFLPAFAPNLLGFSISRPIQINLYQKIWKFFHEGASISYFNLGYICTPSSLCLDVIHRNITACWQSSDIFLLYACCYPAWYFVNNNGPVDKINLLYCRIIHMKNGGVEEFDFIANDLTIVGNWYKPTNVACKHHSHHAITHLNFQKYLYSNPNHSPRCWWRWALHT